MTATLPNPKYAGRWPWYGLPPIDDTAPPGVQLTAKVRPRPQHRDEYHRTLPWLDPHTDRSEQ